MTSSNADRNVQTKGNVAAERAALAGIFRYGIDAYVDVAAMLTEDCFTVAHNKVFYSCVSHALKHQDSLDFSSLLAAAESQGLSEYVNDAGVLKHFEAITHTPVNLENVREYAATILKLDFGRKIQESARDIYRVIEGIDGSESISEIMSLAEAPLQALSLSYLREDQSTPVRLGDGIDVYIDNLLENPVDQIGIPTGFETFDRALGGGLRRKCVDVIGARSGVGKSIIADCVTCAVTKLGIPVLMLDTEMDGDDHKGRVLANLGRVEINEIATGKFGEDDQKTYDVRKAAEEFKSRPYFYLNVSGRPFEEVVAIMRRWVMKEVGYDEDGNMRDCLIIYDYLKLMTSDSINSNIAEYQALGFQITQLHNFCVEYDVPCLTFVQLNRDGISKESTDAVSGSDRIIWLCTSFSIFKEKTPEEIASDGLRAGNCKLIPLKTRHGPGLNDVTERYICMQRDGQFASLTELGTLVQVRAIEEERQHGFEQTGVGEPEEFS